MPESVTHVLGLICYLCTWTIPQACLTRRCSGGREAQFSWFPVVSFAAPLNADVRPFLAAIIVSNLQVKL
jgi:hypothetical protein